MRKKALITGITGQDGSYLAELLLAKGYEVHGIIRRSSSFNTRRIDHLYRDPLQGETNLFLHFGDLADGSRLSNLLNEIKPEEIYNLAAQSHVRVSFDEPLYTGDITGLGSARLLEAVKQSVPDARVYQASSSEMFGASQPPQNEDTDFYPRSPYGAAKVYSYWMTRNYREAYGMFASNGILFNHESPRRGETFVTKKISKAVASIKLGKQKKLFLGNLESRRDWGYAPEYVVAMWKMLQHDEPEDFVIATGSDLSVRDFLEHCFEYVGLDWEKYVEIDEQYFRPTEVDALLGSPDKAKTKLDWSPSVTVQELAEVMVDNDLSALKDQEFFDKPIGKTWIDQIS